MPNRHFFALMDRGYLPLVPTLLDRSRLEAEGVIVPALLRAAVDAYGTKPSFAAGVAIAFTLEAEMWLRARVARVS